MASTTKVRISALERVKEDAARLTKKRFALDEDFEPRFTREEREARRAQRQAAAKKVVITDPVAAAKKEAERVRKEAEAEKQRILEEAKAEAQKRIEEADALLKDAKKETK